jgi:hypothetical protein
MGEGMNTNHEDILNTRKYEGYRLWVERGRHDAWKERKVGRLNMRLFLFFILGLILIFLIQFYYPSPCLFYVFMISFVAIDFINFRKEKTFFFNLMHTNAMATYFLVGQEKRGERILLGMWLSNFVIFFLFLYLFITYFIGTISLIFFFLIIFSIVFPQELFVRYDINRILREYKKIEKEVGGL